METKIYENYQDFLNREDKKMNGVTLAFLEENNINLNGLNLTNCESCFNCVNCRKCNNCRNCEKCENCDNCEN